MSQLETTLTETAPRFHSGTAPQPLSAYVAQSDHAITPDYRAGIASLLLGLRFRTDLTDSEKSLLDTLAGPNGLCFLLNGQTYLHPSGAELFPIEEIRAAAQTPVGTVFTQIKKARSRHQSDYLMMSVTISDQALGRLLFGILVPAGMRRDQRALDRFHVIARQFCQAEESVSRVADSLKAATNSGEPWILVNRTSGKTITVNSSAAGLLKSSPAELSGVEFGALRPRLGQLIGRGLTMTSLGDDLLALCVVTIAAMPPAEHDPPADLFLLEQMRNTAASLRTSAEHLRATTCWKHETDEAELSTMIADGAADLERQLLRMDLLTNYDKLAHRQISLSRSIEIFAEHLRELHPTLKQMHTEFDSGDDTITAPQGAIEHLVEVVLQSHTRDFIDPATVTIATSNQPNGLALVISSRLPNRRRSETGANGWRSVVTHLTSRLAARATHKSDFESHIHTTTITFDHNHRD